MADSLQCPECGYIGKSPAGVSTHITRMHRMTKEQRSHRTKNGKKNRPGSIKHGVKRNINTGNKSPIDILEFAFKNETMTTPEFIEALDWAQTGEEIRQRIHGDNNEQDQQT